MTLLTQGKMGESGSMRGLINKIHVRLHVHGHGVLECELDFRIQDSIEHTRCMSNILQALGFDSSSAAALIFASSGSSSKSSQVLCTGFNLLRKSTAQYHKGDEDRTCF